jgi:WD40 repeat protein
MEFTQDDSKLIVQNAWENQLMIWDLNTLSVTESIESLPSGANSFALNHDESILAIATSDGIQLLGAETLDLLKTRIGPFHYFGRGNLLSISPDGRWLAVGGCVEIAFEACVRDEIYLWESDAIEPTRILPEAGSDALSFIPNGTVLASGNGDGLILWDVESGRMIPSAYSTQELRIYEIIFHPTENLFITATNLGIVFGSIAPDHSNWEYTTLDRFGDGRTFYVTAAGNNQNIYESSSLASPVIRKIKAGEKLTVYVGPEHVDGLTWWNIDVEGGGGWCEDGNFREACQWGGDGWVVENPDYYSPLP